MKLSFLICFLFSIVYSFGQEKELEVEGGIKIGNVESNPEPGTIRWSGLDFEGWNGEEWISLTGGQTGPITDIEGNSYSTVKIGDQIWMRENLNTSKFNEGTQIPNVIDTPQWIMSTSPGYCYYRNDPNYFNDDAFGLLYNYYSIADTNSRNVCPVGWHVPSIAEWTIMEDYLTENGFGEGGSGNDIAKAICGLQTEITVVDLVH